jgi:hypothetical protein
VFTDKVYLIVELIPMLHGLAGDGKRWQGRVRPCQAGTYV